MVVGEKRMLLLLLLGFDLLNCICVPVCVSAFESAKALFSIDWLKKERERSKYECIFSPSCPFLIFMLFESRTLIQADAIKFEYYLFQNCTSSSISATEKERFIRGYICQEQL